MRGGLGAELPLIPDGEEARQWAERELADPVYQAAEPTPFDRLARAIGQFFESLFSGDVSPVFTPWLALVVVLVIAGLIALALLIWGRPRRSARSRVSSSLFADSDLRSAAQLRRDAEAAAAQGEWNEAIILRFRALAQALVERTVFDPEPGVTVHRFAAEASRAFPDDRDALARTADLFDDVRYLQRSGSEEGYRQVAELDTRLGRTAPQFESQDTSLAAGPRS